MTMLKPALPSPDQFAAMRRAAAERTSQDAEAEHAACLLEREAARLERVRQVQLKREMAERIERDRRDQDIADAERARLLRVAESCTEERLQRAFELDSLDVIADRLGVRHDRALGLDVLLKALRARRDELLSAALT